jgi:hypothetical protein
LKIENWKKKEVKKSISCLITSVLTSRRYTLTNWILFVVLVWCAFVSLLVIMSERPSPDSDMKRDETFDLLIAAGYFRARIRGLQDFDKLVGGLVWCVQNCQFDVGDVDLLDFSEDLTIGRKIALTEKIVFACRAIKCPHDVEPHQIQGLDYARIYPLVKWLVKKAVENGEERANEIRTCSEKHFGKVYDDDHDFEGSKRAQKNR